MPFTHLPSTAEAAVAVGEKRFFTGKPCRNGHLSPRYIGKENPCMECVKAAKQRWKARNPEHVANLTRAYERRKYARRKAENPEAVQAMLRAKYDRMMEVNPEAVRSANRRAQQAWKERDPVAYNAVQTARVVRREASKRLATPSWVDHTKIREFYETADALRMLTGEWYHVDHIIPLRSKTVCGLHVHFNLRILPAQENQQKSNKYNPDDALGAIPCRS